MIFGLQVSFRKYVWIIWPIYFNLIWSEFSICSTAREVKYQITNLFRHMVRIMLSLHAASNWPHNESLLNGEHMPMRTTTATHEICQRKHEFIMICSAFLCGHEFNRASSAHYLSSDAVEKTNSKWVCILCWIVLLEQIIRHDCPTERNWSHHRDSQRLWFMRTNIYAWNFEN